MKKFSLLLLLLFALNAFSQNKKVRIGVNLFPNLSVPFIVTNSTAPVTNPSIGYGYTTPLYSKEKFSFSGNVFVQLQLSNRFKVNVGLGYMNNGNRTAPNGNVATLVVLETPTLNQHHVEVPIAFQLYFGNRFYWTAGISPVYNFLSTSSTDNETIKITSDFYRTFNLFANMGLGLDYIKKDNYSLYLQPYAQYGFLGVGKDVPQNLIMFSFGLSAGVRI